MPPITPDDWLQQTWLASLADPFRDSLLADGPPSLDRLLDLLPPVQGEPAFDGEVIESNVERLSTQVHPDTGHGLLDRSVLVGLAMIDATFQADHPKYGIKGYGQTRHDGFPPTIIAAVDALSAWGLHARAEALLGYWLDVFVAASGDVAYYGTSLSEYGQLLHTAVRLAERGGADRVGEAASLALAALAEWMLRAIDHAGEELVSGSPEADEREQVARYFHNNAWLAVGLTRYVHGCQQFGFEPPAELAEIAATAEALRARTLEAIRETWPADPADRWLAPQVEPCERPTKITGTRLGSYTNYRYWPELLASGILPDDLTDRVIDARLEFGGQLAGATRFRDWLDDWPLYDHLVGLWRRGRKDDFLLCLYGHVALHQAEGHLTAYEQVTLPAGAEKAPYCLPCQLVAARAVALMQGR